MFKSKKEDIRSIKETSIEEIKNVSKASIELIEGNLGTGFKWFAKSNKLEKKLNEKDQTVIELKTVLTEKDKQLELEKSRNEKILSLLKDLVKQITDENKLLKNRIKELESNKYKVVKVKSCTELNKLQD